MRAFTGYPLALAVAVALTGCGGRLAPVQGTITYQGKPVTTGNILFVPDAGGPTAMSDIQRDGGYRLNTDGKPGAAPGKYKVMIISMEDTSARLPEERNPLPGLLLPARFGDLQKSGLTAEVKDQGNEIHFPLK
jgi:hypothetical protein